ncbi:hypothetical protein KDW_05710 [Dictyobacter vulcani]|uniref:NAD/GMP synthase domain-containing protein n=1 Tax=Dictyobacter vulcani TaxID=2607529 RepID=A0A5J4KJR1_9CHLR|nr:hypothetical protein [Dictyobacter vulcani]GER86409.1 hypothetical protein KDW_05710 [Dictyobacter vulcani]
MLDTSHIDDKSVVALDAETQAKYEHLQAILRAMGSVLIAYSGGVDSALLLKVAHDVLGDRALGAIASSPAYASEETEEAIAVARQLQLPLVTLETHELENAMSKTMSIVAIFVRQSCSPILSHWRKSTS